MTCLRALSLTFVLALTFTAGCKKDDAKPAPAKAGDKPAGDKPAGDKPAGDKPAADQPATAVAKAKVGASMTCAALVPKDAADKFMPGATAADDNGLDTKGLGTTAKCMYANGTAVTVVMVMCMPWDEGTFKETLKASRDMLDKPTDVPGVGKMAHQGSMSGISMVQFLDDDTPCYGSVAGSNDPVGLAKVLVGTVNPTTTK